MELIRFTMNMNMMIMGRWWVTVVTVTGAEWEWDIWPASSQPGDSRFAPFGVFIF